KPVGNDLATGKLTLPIIRALQLSKDGFHKRVREVAQRGHVTEEELAEIVRTVRDLRGVDYARDAAGRFAGAAASELGRLPDSPEKRALHELTDYVLQRTA
ncbi:MAG: hypothetical protein ACE5O2_15890, partial [Armatimonadota bacterium]